MTKNFSAASKICFAARLNAYTKLTDLKDFSKRVKNLAIRTAVKNVAEKVCYLESYAEKLDAVGHKAEILKINSELMKIGSLNMRGCSTKNAGPFG